jgi:hypothetical protein
MASPLDILPVATGRIVTQHVAVFVVVIAAAVDAAKGLLAAATGGHHNGEQEAESRFHAVTPMVEDTQTAGQIVGDLGQESTP